MRLRSPLAPLAALCTLLLAGCSGPPDAAAPALSVTGPRLASAGAGPPLAGSGTGIITALEITSSRSADGNVIQERRLEGVLSGALTGTMVEHARGVVHSTGLVTFQATLEFTGTVAGCGTGPGTLTAAASGTGQTGLPVVESTIRVIDDAHNTLKVAGTGTLDQVGPLVTYDVRYVCR